MKTATPLPLPSVWLNIQKAAAYCGYSTSRLRTLAREGKVKSVQPTGRYRFRTDWLDEFMLGFNPLRPNNMKTPKLDPAIRIVNGKVKIDI
jgi:hypothetical protein